MRTPPFLELVKNGLKPRYVGGSGNLIVLVISYEQPLDNEKNMILRKYRVVCGFLKNRLEND